MKQVIQLDQNGYFHSVVNADPSPLEKDVWLIPAGCIDVQAPTIPEGMRAKWNGACFEFEEIPQPIPQAEYVPTYAELRAAEYPPITDYLDGLVKGDKAQIDAYMSACIAIKKKYPKI